jgi:hypothetical protein
LSLVSSFIRDALARVWRGYPYDPGAAWTFGPSDYYGIYARSESRRTWRGESG